MSTPLLLFLISLGTDVMGKSPTIAKPDSTPRYENVPIPYSFGIETACCLNPWYALNCNFNKAILISFNPDVIDTSTGEGVGRLFTPVLKCMCKRDFDGNPYLFGGSQDIDERMEKKNICGPNMSCRNQIGTYECHSQWIIIFMLMVSLPSIMISMGQTPDLLTNCGR
ncbi:hypothetical protein Ddye_022749 [Dipteronia dyeriana]|uniref:Uncharacterized protein n=1 Tax=Dipteronia dyeriana TaxID=168575 RepID=A0AAD9TS98_9ROSI|nr:hypothetical protein Ddye_022749 [Dipteronia dyeriana]